MLSDTSARPKVLVVDDDAARLNTLRIFLTAEGFEISTAPSGLIGLERIQHERFQLVLSDLRMPDVSGLEVLAVARQAAPDTPVALFTAYGTAALQRAAVALGAAAYLDGLWDLDAVAMMVRDVLANRPHSRGVLLSYPATGPGTSRWTEVVMGVVASAVDLPTLAHLCSAVSKSPGTIKRICGACDVKPSDTLDFARGLRLAFHLAGHRCKWFDALDIRDASTMQDFFDKTGFGKGAPVPPPAAYISRQRLITDEHLIDAVRAALRRHGV